MARKPVVTERHMVAARLLLNGETCTRALRAAGFGKASSRRFGCLYRESAPLRKAIAMEMETRKLALPEMKVRASYSRKALVDAIRDYGCFGNDSNIPALRQHEQELVCRKISEGTWKPDNCPTCYARLEGKDRWCPRCQKVVMQ